MTIRKIVSVLVPLFIGIVVFPIVYSWDNSDVRGWWPFMVFFGGLSILPYTGLFFLIEKIRASSPRHIFLYSSFVAFTYIGFAILSVSLQDSFDWLAFNEGRLEMSLWQKMINSDYISLWLALLFLCIHIGVVVYKKLYSKTDEMVLKQANALPKNFGYYSLLLIILGILAFVAVFL